MNHPNLFLLVDRKNRLSFVDYSKEIGEGFIGCHDNKWFRATSVKTLANQTNGYLEQIDNLTLVEILAKDRGLI